MNMRLQSLHLAIGAANPFELPNRLCELYVSYGRDPLQERGSFSINYNFRNPQSVAALFHESRHY